MSSGEGWGVGGLLTFFVVIVLKVMVFQSRYERREEARARNVAEVERITRGPDSDYGRLSRINEEGRQRVDQIFEDMHRQTASIRGHDADDGAHESDGTRAIPNRHGLFGGREEMSSEHDAEMAGTPRNDAAEGGRNPFAFDPADPFGIGDNSGDATPRTPVLTPVQAFDEAAKTNLRAAMRRVVGTWRDRANRRVFLEFDERSSAEGIAFWIRVRYAQRSADGRFMRDSKGQDVWGMAEAMLHTNERNEFVADLSGLTTLVVGRGTITVNGPQLQGTFDLATR